MSGPTPFTESLVLAALGDVLDPELGLTLTSPGCPLGDQIAAEIVAAASSVPGVGGVRPRLVFSPPWSPEMIDEDVRFALGY